MGLEWEEIEELDDDNDRGIIWKTECSSGVKDLLKVSNDMKDGCGIILISDEGERISVWIDEYTVAELIDKLGEAVRGGRHNA